MPPTVVPQIVRRTLYTPAVIPPALPSVVLVAGMYISFLWRLLTSVLRRGFQRPFFGVRYFLRRPFLVVIIWSFFGVRCCQSFVIALSQKTVDVVSNSTKIFQ